MAPFVARGLVVDLDGTLIDTEPLYYDAYAAVAAEFGKAYSFDVHRLLLGRAEIEGAGNWIEALGLGGGVTPHDVLARRDVHFLDAVRHVGALPGALATLRAASAVMPVAIATSSCRSYLPAKQANNADLFACVAAVVCGDDAAVGGHSKPHPAIFEAGAAAHGAAPPPGPPPGGPPRRPRPPPPRPARPRAPPPPPPRTRRSPGPRGVSASPLVWASPQPC